MLFRDIEKALREKGNASYLRAYEKSEFGRVEKRVGFSTFVLHGADGDEECLRTLGEVLEEHLAGFLGHGYWDVVDLAEKRESRAGDVDVMWMN